MTDKNEGVLDQALAAGGAYPLSVAQRRGDVGCLPLNVQQRRAVETWNAQHPGQATVTPQHLRGQSPRERRAARRSARRVTRLPHIGRGGNLFE